MDTCNNDLGRALELCDLQDDELNEWEAKFVNDVTLKLEREEPITDRQREVLEKLWKRECR